MRPFDLHELTKAGDRSEKTFWQSMEAAVNVLEGKDVMVLSLDENTAKDFMNQVKKRLEEHDRLLGSDQLQT